MTVEEPKPRGRVAAAILAGSALTLSSFAVSVPAAFAQPEASETPTSEPTETPTDESTETPTEEPTETPTDESTETPTGEPTEDDPSETASPDPSETETGVPDDGEPGDTTLNVDQNEVAQGETLTVTGSGFTPGAEVSVEATLTDPEVDQDPITATAQAVAEEEDNSGSFSAFLKIPTDAAPGEYDLVAAQGEDITVATTFTVSANENEDDEDGGEEPYLTASHDEITLDKFVGAEEDEPGVHFTVSNLDDVSEINYSVEGPGGLQDLNRSTIVQDEVAKFFIYGFDYVTDPSVYLGDYSVTVTFEDEAEETQIVGTHEFSVVEAPLEGPQISFVDSDEVYQGGVLEVEVTNLEPEGEVTFEWNPTETMEAGPNGDITAELPIAEDADTGVQELTVTDEATGEWNSVEYTVLEADVTEPSLIIDPETITLDEFIGDPEDGAGVTHVVEGLEPGTEITAVVTGPEGVNDYEDTENVDDEGRVEFVIYGYDVANPEVYLGDYNSVVTYVDEDGNFVELTGEFTVVTGDDAPGVGSDDDEAAAPAGGAPTDLNGTSLADTGASGAQLGLLAGTLLLAGGAFLAYANRGRLFTRKH